MSIFQDYLMIDWSAANERRTGKDSIWYVLLSRDGNGLSIAAEGNPATRLAARHEIRELLVKQAQAGRRTLVGCDFPFGYPRGVAGALGTGSSDWRSTWSELESRISDAPSNANNRFEVATALNQALTNGPAPFWACPKARSGPFLTEKKAHAAPFAEFRHCESWAPSAKSVWQLFGNGSVGSQALMGIPAVSEWRYDPDLAGVSQVWPFETGLRSLGDLDAQWLILHAEVYPSLVAIDGRSDQVKDRQQVEAIGRYFADLDDAGQLADLFACPVGLTPEQKQAVETEEGWILGLQHDMRRKPTSKVQHGFANAFPLGYEFPNEGFVQCAIETFFTSNGYRLLDEGYTDLACAHSETGERWLVEAKGKSMAIGTDFNSGLGQLLKRMRDEESAHFGLAMPDIPAYRRQVDQVSARVRRALELHWLFVAEDGAVQIIKPEITYP